MFESIKNWFFYREFKTDKVIKKSVTGGINNIRSVCILFDGSSEEDRKTVHRFKKKLDPNGHKTIKSLAYIDNKLPLDNVDYAAFNQNDIKWYGLPFGIKVAEFISYDFDLLIVLCKKMLPPFEYIIAHSSARFVIGTDIDKAEKYFDLIVETGNQCDLETMIKEIILVIDNIAIK